MNIILIGVPIKNTHVEANTDKRLQDINCAKLSIHCIWHESHQFDVWLAIRREKKGKRERRKRTTNAFLWSSIILIRRHKLVTREGFWKLPGKPMD